MKLAKSDGLIKRLYSTKEAAEYLGVPVSTLNWLISNRKISYVDVGGDISLDFYDFSDIKEVVERLGGNISLDSANELEGLINVNGYSFKEYIIQKFQPCVYLLYQEDAIVYIGKAECLPRRIQEHIKNGKVFNRVFYMESLNRSRVTKIEGSLIRSIEIKYNRECFCAGVKKKKQRVHKSIKRK